MDIGQLISNVASGKVLSFVLPSDASDLLRVRVITGLQKKGWSVKHLPSVAMLSSELSTPPLDVVETSKTILMVPWPDGSESIKSAAASVGMLSPGEGVVAFICEQFPPRKTKESSHILAVSVVPKEGDNPSWLSIGLDEAGIRLPVKAQQRLLGRIKGCPEALPQVIKSLKIASGGEEITDQTIVDAIPFYPEEDGRSILEDLLYQRSVPLCRRISDMPADKILPLFRIAASEMMIIHQVASLMDPADKNHFVDYKKAAELTGLEDSRIKTRYAPLAASIGATRAALILARLEQADTLLLRSPHDKRAVALSVAVSVCKI